MERSKYDVFLSSEYISQHVFSPIIWAFNRAPGGDKTTVSHKQLFSDLKTSAIILSPHSSISKNTITTNELIWCTFPITIIAECYVACWRSTYQKLHCIMVLIIWPSSWTFTDVNLCMKTYRWRISGVKVFEERRLKQLDAKRQARKDGRNNLATAVACPVCGRICASKFGLRSHLRRHWRHRPFATDIHEARGV